MLVTFESEHLLYCDIKEVSAPRNQLGGWLCPSHSQARELCMWLSCTHSCDQVPHSILQAGFSTGKASGHIAVIIISLLYCSSSYIWLSPNVWQEIYLLLLCFLYFNRHDGGFCGYSMYADGVLWGWAHHRRVVGFRTCFLKAKLALTFDLSSLHNITDIPTGHTSSVATAAGISRGTVAEKSAVGTGSRPEEGLSVGLEMLSKRECRPKKVRPIGPTYWALPKDWGPHIASVYKGQNH